MSWDYSNVKYGANALWNAMRSDYMDNLNKYGKTMNISPFSQLFASDFSVNLFKTSMYINDDIENEALSSVLDITFGASKGTDASVVTHEISYYIGANGARNACTEFFAEAFETALLGERYSKTIKKYYPNAWEVFMEMVNLIQW